MSQAEQFAARFHDDGQRWTSTSGQSWDDVAHEMDAYFERNDARDAVRLTFTDGSVITAVGDGWDYGFPGCWCWAGCPRDGHDAARCNDDQLDLYDGPVGPSEA